MYSPIEKKKVSRLNLWDGILYFEIGPSFNYTLYHATYHYPVNGLYRLDLAWADEYLKHYDAKEKGYEDLPEPVSVLQNKGAMGASYAEIAYYDPLVRGGKLYYWVNNDYKKGRQLYCAELNGKNDEMLYDSADRKVISWTVDDERIYISDDKSIFSIEPNGKTKKIGVFSLRSRSSDVRVEVPDGTYPELISGKPIQVTGSTIRCEGKPIIISMEK